MNNQESESKAETVEELRDDVLSSSVLFATYWNKMPEWARCQYYQDGITNNVVNKCAMTGAPVDKLGWELARVMMGERDSLRNRIHDLAHRPIHVIYPANNESGGVRLPSRPSGIACPKCGKEMHDRNGNVLTSNPPKKAVICSECGHNDFALA